MTSPTPPVAAKKDHTVVFGHVEGENRGGNPMKEVKTKNDPYYWMRDDNRESEDVISHLNKENEYTEAKTDHLKDLTDTVYKEMLSHVKETDESAPVFKFADRKNSYYSRTVKDLAYRIYCRRPAEGGEEEVLIDGNVLGKDEKHFDLKAVNPSPSEKLLGFCTDTTGDEVYTVFIRNLASGEEVDRVANIKSFTWGGDDDTIYYTKQDEAKRPYQVWIHKVGTSTDKDVKVFEELDGLYYVGAGKYTHSRYMCVSAGSSETSVGHIIDLQEKVADGQAPTLMNISPKEYGVELREDIREGRMYIVTNADGAQEFKLVSVALDKLGTRDNWEPVKDKDGNVVFGPSETANYSSVECFKDFAFVYGREDGFTQVWVLEFGKEDDDRHVVQQWHRIKFNESAYNVGGGANYLYDTDRVRLSYTSMVCPATAMDYVVATKDIVTVKVAEVPNYDLNNYFTTRIEAPSHDGTMIPMTVVMNKKLYPDGKPSNAPLHLYGYGSYSICIDPAMNPRILPLLDRGIVYVVAHVRGGGEMGYFKWYKDQGKYLNKRNTFLDFVACAEHLQKIGWTDSSHMSMEGRSAGGLLMGAVLNMRPDLFKAVLAGVPFVDVCTTMADASIPLTVGEWEEWGNPNEEQYHDYMMSYSPMDNIKDNKYPSILITAGLHDPRVAYWEPMKWVASLREHKQNSEDDEWLLLKVDMSSGHFSASDRYKLMKERSFEYAFLLARLGLDKTNPV